MVLTAERPRVAPRFATVEELEQWVLSASDADIVAIYEESGTLPLAGAAYGRELIEAARARLDDTREDSPASGVASAAD